MTKLYYINIITKCNEEHEIKKINCDHTCLPLETGCSIAPTPTTLALAVSIDGG